MKLLQLLAYILPKKWFVALLASKYCKSIRLRLLSRSFDDKIDEIYICFRLRVVIGQTFKIRTSSSEIQKIFKMSYTEAVQNFKARAYCYYWWNYNDPNRQKYHSYLFLIQ